MKENKRRKRRRHQATMEASSSCHSRHQATMEAAPVSAATAALKPVLEKLAALMARNDERFQEVRKEIPSLSHELAAIHAFLLKRSEVEEDPDPQDKAWINEVRELSYDMKDSIDDFMQHVDDNDAQPNGLLEKIKHSLGKLGKMKKQRLINSYFDLPLCLKKCLLYLSLFPEDCIIEKEKLIQIWIAEGFIHREEKYTSAEVGEKCFDELVNRSLIQPVKTLVNGKVESCRVYDIILDFIISKSVEENFVTFVGGRNRSTKTQSKVRRLSLQAGKQGSSILKRGESLSRVRSLSMFGESVKIPSLDRFKHLRVMDLEGCRRLKTRHLANIGSLFQLRFLSFNGCTSIDELPEKIGDLRFLETLDLRDTYVGKLPESIVKLENLVHLLGDGFPLGFPNGIAKMQALETLQYVSAFRQSLEFLRDLGRLQNMRKLKLYLYCTTASSVKEEWAPSVTEEWVEALLSSLRKLGTHNLRSVDLSFYPCSLLMKPWCSPSDLAGLQELFARGTAVPHVPDWMRFLVNLQRLQIGVDGVRQKDLCILGGLPVLLSLTLSGRSKEKLVVNGGVGFSCLKEFAYTVNGGMELMFANPCRCLYCEWRNGVGFSRSMPMPKLEILEITFDAVETKSLCGGAAAFDFGIENLPCLVTLDCDCAFFPVGCDCDCDCEYAKAAKAAKDSAIEAAKAAMERVASTHPNSPTLHFKLY